jgi:hypothetical protein
MTTKREIVEKAIRELTPGEYISQPQKINTKRIKRVARKIGGLQRSVEDIAETGPLLRRLWGRMRTWTSPHSIDELMGQQHIAISYVKGGMEGIRTNIDAALLACEEYWHSAEKAPLDKIQEEEGWLIRLRILTEEKRRLSFQSYDAEEDTERYFRHKAEHLRVERELKHTLDEYNRCRGAIQGMEPRLEKADELIRYLNEQRQRVEDWYELVQESEASLELAKSIVPALANGSEALSVFVRLSEQIVRNTAGLTSHEFSKSYARIENLGRLKNRQLSYRKSTSIRNAS